MIRKRRKAVAFIVLVVSMVLFAEPYQNKQKIYSLDSDVYGAKPSVKTKI
jgi:hypothetical protein